MVFEDSMKNVLHHSKTFDGVYAYVCVCVGETGKEEKKAKDRVRVW